MVGKLTQTGMAFMKLKLSALLRDRLVWFVAIGLLLFAIDWAVQRQDNRTINIDLPLVEKLVAQWEGQTKRRPTAQELDALIEGHIREEIMVREARRLGLDDEDVIIRRRLAQKLEFFLAENDPPGLPDEAVLRAWFEANRSLYDAPVKLSWRHIFANDETEAARLLAQVKNRPADWQTLGQPFMLSRAYARQAAPQLAQNMGADFADNLFAATQNGWFGPLRSAYGWHIVEITERHAAQAAQFLPLADKIADDWQDEQARLAQQQAWQALRGSYAIELQPLEGE